jgi:serine/threonine protein kinase
MSEPNRCPECGAELPTGALAGLCPKCLLAAGLESGADEQKRSGDAPTTPHGSGFVPPELAWLAAHFPQLEILELLGCGGMGAVYKARQPRLDRFVALKIIRTESADAPAFAERFNREARMLARLSHPHIVAVYDFGEVHTSDAGKEGRPLYYFLMEYVDGANLRELMRAGELTPAQALAIVPQICEALQFAHDDGIVHRDIKPENILLDTKGRVKIADFGLAKLSARSPAEFTLTATHQVMGTPRYMAPEQMEGSHAVDHRADIVSLGVVFYEMLTGEVPAGHFEPPSKRVQIDVRLDEVILRAMAREPQRRYQQASEVKTEVESISGSQQIDAGSRPAPARGGRDERDLNELGRRRVRWPAIALIALGGLNIFLVLMYVLGTLADWEERGWEPAWQ